ncbi:uncharacterized protein AB675_4272 [Cyphellophora attinorum]|uniref:Protein kinase domain-containing protein n=1 Tax=Cyphellophora attinorum TaxID=1664694 RepID=A0A0N0NKZ7_9EURO|nr:uncharacterized protein AB675_4272 [Phialophora attinorum]KPI38598.1 hypothetical protein AB675_4272 [Phialophora attinorum]
MAQRENLPWTQQLHLETQADKGNVDDEVAVLSPPAEKRPSFSTAGTSQDTIRATPPIAIPSASDEQLSNGVEEDGTYMERFMRTRKPSISFNSELKLDCGQTQSIDQPLKKPPTNQQRGRSMLQVLNAEARKSRAHSDSDRERYDPITGRHLPKYSTSPTREQPRIGEARFPVLQTTVDEMARESQTHVPTMSSLTSESTASPTEEVHTPTETDNISPIINRAAFSFEEKPFKRTASQRWREAQSNGTSQENFFTRAGSLKHVGSIGRAFSSPRLARRETATGARSPRSAASSYLRAFSMSSSTDGDGSEGAPPAVDAEGQTIGEDYVIGKQIGWGGFSVIKEVTQIKESTQRKLAVKIVRRHVEGKSDNDNEQVQAEFEHEVELWRFLDHPHVLPLEAVYKLDEATFCFIPLSTGGTLFDLVRSNRQGIAPDVAGDYTHQIASALRYLHQDARVVHRDVKLENCLLDRHPSHPNGLIRLCDFGMAEWISRDEGEGSSSGPPSPLANNVDRPPQRHIGPAGSSTSAFTGGSLEYAAPEILRLSRALAHPDNQAAGREHDAERSIVSPSVDIWALGVCIYSLIVGSRPFHNTFQPRVVMSILAGDWDVERLASKGGDDVVECVKGCLEMESSDRWDVLQVLESTWLSHLGFAGEEDSPWKL